ncbi:hypothetical protein, partial [Pseudomonas amygdali]|uniref:hypothetical protein n=1 Tax=Pseudomonas amygdali TaxID=47877 RepID=UPI0019D3BA83
AFLVAEVGMVTRQNSEVISSLRVRLWRTGHSWYWMECKTTQMRPVFPSHPIGTDDYGVKLSP